MKDTINGFSVDSPEADNKIGPQILSAGGQICIRTVPSRPRPQLCHWLSWSIGAVDSRRRALSIGSSHNGAPEVVRLTPHIAGFVYGNVNPIYRTMAATALANVESEKTGVDGNT